MEYLDGNDAEAPDRGKPMDMEDLFGAGERLRMRWMRRMRKGIVHRDIKPANIFVTGRGAREDSGFWIGQGGGALRRGSAERGRRT